MCFNGCSIFCKKFGVAVDSCEAGLICDVGETLMLDCCLVFYNGFFQVDRHGSVNR